MAELIIPFQCANVTSSWSLAGKSNPVTTTMGIQLTDTEDISAVVDEVFNGWTLEDGFCDSENMSTIWTFNGCTALFNNDGVFEAYASTGAPVVGTATQTGPMIVSSSFLMQKRTARAGRAFRGRGYLPIMRIGEAGIDVMGNIDPIDYGIAADALEVTTDFWLDTVTTWRPILLHALDVITPPITPITSMTLRTKVATQRRRLRS